MSKFWNWIPRTDNNDARELEINGVIADEVWWGDEVTPAEFKSELYAGNGDIVVWLNSPGGDVFAANEIYTMLVDYPGKVTVKITGIAASAATVIAMAGDTVLMSLPAMMMIHNPATIAYGDHNAMEKAAATLDEVREAIVNAYERKTGMQRAKLVRLMEEETWMNAKAAVENGFADGFIEDEAKAPESYTFSENRMNTAIVNKLTADMKPPEPDPEPELEPTEPEGQEEQEEEQSGRCIDSLMQSLSLYKKIM